MVLNALDSMSGKWNMKEFFKTLGVRITYGVKAELVDLCRIPNVGKVRAEKLWAAGLRKPSDLVNDPDKVQKVLNMKKDTISKIIKEAESV
jgi:helicase